MKKMVAATLAMLALISSLSANTITKITQKTNGETTLKNTFTIASWDETTYLELENDAKYANAKLLKQYSGELKGQGQLEYLMAYSTATSAYFTGLEHFTGTLGEKRGTLTIAHEGVFKGGQVSSSFRIIDGSQTGELAGVTGEGHYNAGHSMTVDFNFTHSLGK